MFGAGFNPLDLLFGLGALMIAITVHEFSHAAAAERLGDPTPRLMGRLTLNPIPHIDLFGTILLPLLLAFSGTGFIFGWAKPVVFDPFNLRHPRRDSAIISLMGPIANMLLAILCALIIRVTLPAVVTAFFTYILILNVVLAIFNLIPIHPLDGFKIVEGILPEKQAREWHELERYGMLFLIVLIFPIFGGTAPLQRIISPVISFILSILLPSTAGFV